MKNVLRRQKKSLVLAFLLMSSPLSAGTEDLETLMTWLDGHYSNQSQVGAGVLDAESNLLFPVFREVDAPAFGEHVIYLQWHIGSPDGRLQRQRIWSFGVDAATGGIYMDFFTLKEPEKWLNAHTEPEKVRTMTLQDVIGYPTSCRLPVTFDDKRFVARIPATCVIVSQSTQTAMTLQAETIIAADHISYQEAGLRENGAVVFQVPPAGRYVFEPTTP